MPVFNPADGIVLIVAFAVFIALLWPERKIPEPWWAPEEVDPDGR